MDNNDPNNQLPKMSSKWKPLPSLLLGFASIVLIFLGGPFAGKGIEIIAYGFLVAAGIIAVRGLNRGMNELRLGKKVSGAAGIAVCSIALLMCIYTGSIELVMKTY